jgi:uncharacterized membrane protein
MAPGPKSSPDHVGGSVNRYSRSILAGAATGGRSFTGLAAVVLNAPPGIRGRPGAVVLERPVKVVVATAALAEYAVDKLPWVPSRLRPLSLGLRGLNAAAAGYLIASRRSWHPGADDSSTVSADHPGAVVACCGIAAVTALATAWLGAQWRAWAAARLGGDAPGALVEDAVVLTLAAVVGRSTDDAPGVSRHR